jgi:hypothetical protein
METTMRDSGKKATPVVSPVVSETSCPSGWSETSARSDNLAACLRNTILVIAPELTLVSAETEKFVVEYE